jgi:uncharacterized membrane protein YfcA
MGIEFLLAFTGFFAGFIDSIAGGGGLITLPALGLVFGLGPEAIGTNKIVGFAAAFLAYLVYLRARRQSPLVGLGFAFFIGIGAWIGGTLSPLLPTVGFKYLLMLTCPFILYLVSKKDLWVAMEVNPTSQEALKMSNPKLILSGLLVGFYDGAWGPGGGTFMLLSLLFIVKMPLFDALTASKLANTFSAGFSLTRYALSGYVHWRVGLLMAIGSSLGALLGATLASRVQSKVMRPILALVAVGLMMKVIFT